PVAKHYYMAADLTALPAVAALLEKMPAEAQGNVVIRIDHADDQQVLNKPAGITLHWVTGGTEKTAEVTAL
ncbi:SIP domain-containing protein, partial [Morganella morganii]